MRNQAFAFLKPHAMGSQPIVNAVADRLEEAGVRVSHMERIGADRLAAEGLYDRHVGPVARAALAPDPAALFDADARARFAERFEEPFAAVVAEGRLLSAPAAAARFEGGPDDLLRLCAMGGTETIAPDCHVLRFEPPCACGHAHAHAHDHGHDCACGHDHGHDCACGHDHGHAHGKPLYAVNAFYAAERAPYADPAGPGVMAMTLDFDLPWRDFLDVVIGDENPAGALEESIRGFLYDRRDALGMRIDRFDNVLHASVSPLDALCEKAIWLPAARRRADPLLKLLRADARLPRRGLLPALQRLREAGTPGPALAGLDTPDAAPLVAEALLAEGARA